MTIFDVHSRNTSSFRRQTPVINYDKAVYKTNCATALETVVFTQGTSVHVILD